MSWYPIIILVFAGVFLFSNKSEVRLSNFRSKTFRQYSVQITTAKASQLDQSMVSSIIASSLAAGVAPQIAIKSALSYLPIEQASRYLAAIEGMNHSSKPDFLEENLKFVMESLESGNQVALALNLKIENFQAKHKLHILTLIKKAEVWMLAPLGICFLPTFILLTIIPLVASMMGNFFN